MSKNLVALISGGASGLGKSTVERLSKEGYKITLCDLPTSKGKEVAESFGSNVKFVPTDVRSTEDVTNAVNTTKDVFGKLDVVVNCAAISVAHKIYNFHKDTVHHLDDFIKVMNVNVAGTYNVNRLAVGLIGKNTPDEDGYRGIIINTSGFAAFDGGCGQTAISASHGAIASMTLPLARDLAIQGIRCCTIAPGLFTTPITEILPPKVIHYFSSMTPFPQRLGKPEEYAQLVVSLIENTYINGEVIRLDGGLRLSQ